jgi:hypothetical protein
MKINLKKFNCFVLFSDVLQPARGQSGTGTMLRVILAATLSLLSDLENSCGTRVEYGNANFLAIESVRKSTIFRDNRMRPLTKWDKVVII